MAYDGAIAAPPFMRDVPKQVSPHRSAPRERLRSMALRSNSARASGVADPAQRCSLARQSVSASSRACRNLRSGPTSRSDLIKVRSLNNLLHRFRNGSRAHAIVAGGELQGDQPVV